MGRVEKVAEALKKEISSIIQFELKDPRIGFVTVTRVDLTKDLEHAKIYFSILGNPAEEKNTVIALESAKGFIRRLIAERIKLRLVPEIIFRLDKSIEYSIRIQEEIEKLRSGNESKKSSRGDKQK